MIYTYQFTAPVCSESDEVTACLVALLNLGQFNVVDALGTGRAHRVARHLNRCGQACWNSETAKAA